MERTGQRVLASVLDCLIGVVRRVTRAFFVLDITANACAGYNDIASMVPIHGIHSE